MLNGIIMDGISLDGIMSMVVPMLPTLSYLLNFVTRALDIFAAYLGIDLTLPEVTPDAGEGEGTIE